MAPIRRQARARVPWWDHVHGGHRDLWQLADELGGGGGFTRAMSDATRNLEIPSVGHHDLVEVATWDRYELWRFLR